MKKRVAFFDFASCNGCQLQVANLEESVIDLIHIVEIASFGTITKKCSNDYDIAFIEGSITRPIDEERLKTIRNRAKIIVALGSCANTGGINRLRNQFSIDYVKEVVYNGANIKNNLYFDIFPIKPVSEIVKVDYYIPGCPINRDELTKVITSLVLNGKPEIPNYPICVECKKKENICVFEEGKFCLGPVIRGGCGAICPTNKNGCEGCRGLLDNPNIDSELEILCKYGLTLEAALDRFKIFCYKEEGTK